jgi:RNA polymerase sigma factor for flagellar operon FliA
MAPHALVIEHLDLVPRLARKLRLSPNSSVWDDAIQAGRVGLIEAAGRYNPALGTPFREYAVWFVLGALKDALCAEPLISPIRRASREAIERSEEVVSVEFDAAAGGQRVPRQLVDLGVEDRAAEALDAKRRAAEVRAAVRELPEKPAGAAAAVLSDLMTPTQYAAAKGISQRSVFNYLAESRRALAESLQPEPPNADTPTGAKVPRLT